MPHKQIKVFVVDKFNRPCLPCTSARARLLLKQNKATVLAVLPFAIKLNYEVKNPIGSFTIGIDDGAKEVGIALVNEKTNEVVFGGTIRLRQDVKRKMTQRKMYRVSRRARKTRYRMARFNNRSKKGNSPTIRTKKDSIMRTVLYLSKCLNITKGVVEQGMFDISSLAKGKKLNGKEYQQSDFEGENQKAKVRWRDKYECQKCFGKDFLQIHHIIERKNGGTNALNNLITLCKECHRDLHSGLWRIEKSTKHFKYPSHLQQGKNYLLNTLNKIINEVKIVYGWQTSKWRKNLNLTKEHYNDAIAMACKERLPLLSFKDYLIIPKRKKIWENNPTKTCVEKNGFKHGDLVKAVRTKIAHKGIIRSLKRRAICIKTKDSDNFEVSYSKTKLLYRFGSIQFC